MCFFALDKRLKISLGLGSPIGRGQNPKVFKYNHDVCIAGLDLWMAMFIGESGERIGIMFLDKNNNQNALN